MSFIFLLPLTNVNITVLSYKFSQHRLSVNEK